MDSHFTSSSANVTNWEAGSFNVVNSTQGQAIALGSGSVHNGIGDTLGASISAICHGGFVAHTDEGCEGMDLQVYQSGNHGYTQDYTSQVASGGGGAGVSTVVLVAATTQAGEGLQGAGRYLLDAQGVTTVAGTTLVSTSTFSGSMPAYYTITGNNKVPISTFVAPLGKDIPVADVVTTVPLTPTVGVVSNLTTNSLLCIADQYSPLEFIKPSSVSSPNITIATTRPHTAQAIITSGGACGSFLSITADNITPSTYQMMVNPVTGTMLQAWPILETVNSGSKISTLPSNVKGSGAHPFRNSTAPTTRSRYIREPRLPRSQPAACKATPSRYLRIT